MSKEAQPPKNMIKLDLDFHRKAAQIRFLVRTREKCSKSNSVFLLTIAYWCGLHIKRIDEWHFKPRLKEVCKKESILRYGSTETLHPNFSILMSLMENKNKISKNVSDEVLKRLV